MDAAVVRLIGRASEHWNEKRQLQGSGDELDASWEEELQRLPEVRIINKYAVLMAYIRIGLKGVGALALLWGTVVLLGGFVSKLKKKDFWFLTSIALVQAAGLSDAMGDDRFAFLMEWITFLERNTTSWRQMPFYERLRLLKNVTLHAIMFVVFSPAAYFAVAGPAICVVLSALRVAKQDYVFIVDGDKPDPDTANLKPALNLFYYVSLVHGAIYILYMKIELVFDEALVEIVSRQHGLSPKVLDGYLHETKRMCVNSPASTESWSLITYGAGLLDSQLPEDYASGGRVLAMLIDQDIPVTRLLIRSPRQRIQKLIGTLAWRSPAEREMRWFAARIVERLAGHLNLAHFPGALECISSLFDTSCQNNGDREALCLPFVIGRSKPRKRKSFLRNTFDSSEEEDEDGYRKVPKGYLTNIAGVYLAHICKKYLSPTNGGTLEQDIKQREKENGEQIDEDLVLPGLRILENLAHDKHNCTLIYNTKDLLSRVVAPVSSDKLVEDIKNNAAWTKVVAGSLKVMSRLMGSPGSTGEEMRSRIEGDENAVNNLEAVLDMDMKSNSSMIELQIQTIEFLAQLILHHPVNSAMGRREKLVKSVLRIFSTKNWMEEYLEDEKSKIDKLTASKQNTLSRPSLRTHLNNLVQEVNGEGLIQRAAEARVERMMKEAQEAASRLKEKAGEALAMLSSDSEAIKLFTPCEDVVLCLTELLDSKIMTLECKISATDTVEIGINVACRISAAVILKNLSNHVKLPTLRKVLAELFPIQAETSTTNTSGCWGRVTSYMKSIRNDIELQTGGGQVEPSASQRPSHIERCGERRLQAELLSLVAAIRASFDINVAALLISQPQPVSLEAFVVRLREMVEDNMYATPACLAIQKLTCNMVIDIIPRDQNFEVIEKHKIVGTLLEASKKMAGLEASMLFAGVDQDCHGVPLRPLSSDLAKQAENLLTQRKQELGINTVVPASVP